jgi:hypothetical protein
VSEVIKQEEFILLFNLDVHYKALQQQKLSFVLEMAANAKLSTIFTLK